MSNKFLRLTWGLKPLGNPSQRLLLAALADHADDEGRCWPSSELLQAETGLSERTITRNLDGLAACGLIEIQRKAVGTLHRNSLYILSDARLEEEQRTPVMVTDEQDDTPVTVTAVQPSSATPSPVTMTAALEPPLTPNRTPIQPRLFSSKREKRETKEVPPFVLAACVSTQAWDNFEQHRIRKGAPMNDLTRWQVLARLQRFHAEGQNTDEIIENSIIGNWTGVFPLKTASARFTSPGITRPIQAIDKLRRVA